MARPELFEAAHPALVNLPDRHHVQRVDALSPLLTRVNQAGTAEHVDVLHDAETAQVRKGLHDPGRRARPLAQEVENRAAGVVAQGLPHTVEVVLGHLGALRAGAGGTVLGDAFQDLLPAAGHILPVTGVNEADGAVAEIDMRSAGALLQLHFDVVQRRIGHEQGPAQFQQQRRLDHLHVSPEMADAVAAVAEPATARPLLQCHLHGFALRVGAAFAEPVQQHAAEDVADVGLDVNALSGVERQIVACHRFGSLLNRCLYGNVTIWSRQEFFSDF